MKGAGIQKRARYGLALAGLFAAAVALSTTAGAVQTIPDEHTVVLWRFDEGAGGVAYDEMESGADAAIHGAAWTLGMFGSGLQFDGEDDHLTMPLGAAALDVTGDITVALWFYPDDLDSILIDNRYNFTSNEYGFHLQTLADGRVVWSSHDGNTNANETCVAHSTGKILPGQWNHIAVTKAADSATVTFYINGEPAGTDTIQAAGIAYVYRYAERYIGTGRDFYLASGGFGFGDKMFVNGILDEIMISDIVRTPEEIAAYAAGDNFPVAEAGANRAVTVQETAFLDGAGSYDPEGKPLTYRWYDDLDGDGVLEDGELIATGPTPTVSLTDADIGVHFYQLVVNDGHWDSRPDRVIVGVAGGGRPEPNTALSVSQMKIHWTGDNKLTIHAELPDLPEGAQDGLLPSGTIVTIEVPTQAAPGEYLVGQAEVDFLRRGNLWDSPPK
ncbi:MAG: LamG-like jellyroll fold domain-containing protein [Elusimicrobiota bacterium]